MSCPDCDCIGIGDVVEHKMNTNVFGIVIGFSGSLISIRVSPSLNVLTFHEWELQICEDEDLPPDDEAKQTEGDNVVKVDFTRERDLRKTKTEGAA